jgi:uncharacterized membrane protein YeaQ/YmgE (transglycosylase-associated protein family)
MAFAEQAAHTLLVWVGFGTLVGLAAKAIMPGRDPGGPIATLMMGVGGSVIGCGTLMFFFDARNITPISVIGFATATGGAFILLFFYRLLSGGFITEAEEGDQVIHRRNRRRRKMDLVLDR